MSIADVREKLTKVEGVVVLVLVTTYCALLVILCVLRDEDFKLGFLGFALFAQSLVKQWFDYLHGKKESSDAAAVRKDENEK